MEAIEGAGLGPGTGAGAGGGPGPGVGAGAGAGPGPGPGPGPGALPASYLIVHNVAKKQNIGTLARSATALGVREVCLVGNRHYSTFGSHGADAYVDFRYFATLAEARAYLKGDCGCTIFGIEIADGAASVVDEPWEGSAAFFPGNEGDGLSEQQMAICDSFVYIPQHGPGTASLNVAVATSIVLHRFAAWAGFPERERQGHKFVVGPRPQRTAPRGIVPPTVVEREVERARRAAAGNGEDAAWMAEEREGTGEASDILGNILS